MNGSEAHQKLAYCVIPALDQVEGRLQREFQDCEKGFRVKPGMTK